MGVSRTLGFRCSISNGSFASTNRTSIVVGGGLERLKLPPRGVERISVTVCRNRVGVIVRTNNNITSICIARSCVRVILASGNPKVGSVRRTVRRNFSATARGVESLNFNTKVKLPGVGHCSSFVRVGSIINRNAAVAVQMGVGWFSTNVICRCVQAFYFLKYQGVCQVCSLSGTLSS